MRIKIESESRRGLRIIDEIPDIALCRIQGHNGIGKTNAIKLLSLCAGGTPFRDNSASWLSFRSQLTSARVKVSDLRDGETIEWDLDPSNWPDSPAAPLDDLIGPVRINGHSANLRDVYDLFRVYHIVAAETPQNVLASRVLEAQRDIQGWDAERVVRVNAIDDRIAAARTLIVQASPERIPTEIAAVKESVQRASLLTEKRDHASSRLALLQRAKQVSEHLVEVRGQGPEMDAKLDILRRQLEHIERRKEELNAKIAEASARQHRDAEAERKFTNAQRYLDRHDRAARDARTALDMIAASAEVEPEREVIEIAIRKASDNLSALTERLPKVHAAPLVLEVLDDLISRLGQAESENLGGAELLEGNGQSPTWTVSGLREAMTEQREQLVQRTPSADAAQLNDDIERTRSRLYSLNQARETLTEFEEAEAALVRAKERLRAAAEGLPEQTARTLDDLLESRNELDQEAAKVQTRHARLSHTRELLGGGLDEQTLSAELAQLCKELGVKASRVHSQAAVEADKFEEIVRSEKQAVQQAERAQQALEKHREEINAAIVQLQERSEFRWIRATVEVSKLDSMDSDARVAAFCSIADQLVQARNRLHGISKSVQGIGSALSKLQNGLQTATGQHEEEPPYDPLVRHWLGGEVRRWFDDDLVRQALFDGGTDVRLDPRSMSVFWTNRAGEEERRPLTGFSSGQQVLAYTQAQIAKIDSEELPAANRLIALDEFGSFLDWKNMSSLVNLLQLRKSQTSKEQIVVILPLEEGKDQRNGGEFINEQMRSLEDRGYFAEELSQ